MIEIENVTKVYETGSVSVQALRGITTCIADGEFTAFAGPSGSGKTTLLNVVGCLDSITSGKISIDGQDITTSATAAERNLIRQQKIGFIFQSYNLIPVLTALENVELALQLLKNFSKKEIRERACTILEEVGLGTMLHRKPAELSGGQQQRVSIARALVKNPPVILADEPTANLDSKTGEDILNLMVDLNKKYNTSFVFSTHDKMVMDFARRIVKLHDGLIVSDSQLKE